MVTGLELQSHFLKRETDLPPDVLTPVQRCDVEVAGPVHRLIGRVSVLIGPEEVEFQLRSEVDLVVLGKEFLFHLLQHVPGIPDEGPSVGMTDVTVESYDPALTRPPREECHRGRIGEEQKVGILHIEKAPDLGGVEPYTLIKGPLQCLE